MPLEHPVFAVEMPQFSINFNKIQNVESCPLMFTKEQERPDPFDRFFTQVTGREPSPETPQDAVVEQDEAPKSKLLGKLSISMPRFSFSFGKKSNA